MLLAGCGWVLAAIGLVLLADAQRRNAGSSLGALLRSPVGHALIWRGVAAKQPTEQRHQQRGAGCEALWVPTRTTSYSGT